MGQYQWPWVMGWCHTLCFKVHPAFWTCFLAWCNGSIKFSISESDQQNIHMHLFIPCVKGMWFDHDYGSDRVTLEGVAHVTPIRNTDPNYGCNWLLIHQPAGLKSPQVFFPEHRFRSEHRFRCRGNLTGKKRSIWKGTQKSGACEGCYWSMCCCTYCLFIHHIIGHSRSICCCWCDE
jgi:hypothetical protein